MAQVMHLVGVPAGTKTSAVQLWWPHLTTPFTGNTLRTVTPLALGGAGPGRPEPGSSDNHFFSVHLQAYMQKGLPSDRANESRGNSVGDVIAEDLMPRLPNGRMFLDHPFIQQSRVGNTSHARFRLPGPLSKIQTL